MKQRMKIEGNSAAMTGLGVVTVPPKSSLNYIEEEFKQVQPPTSTLKNVTSLQTLKDSIRKLPMFETYVDETETFDFEWPTKAVLKTMTNAR